MVTAETALLVLAVPVQTVPVRHAAHDAPRRPVPALAQDALGLSCVWCRTRQTGPVCCRADWTCLLSGSKDTAPASGAAAQDGRPTGRARAAEGAASRPEQESRNDS